MRPIATLFGCAAILLIGDARAATIHVPGDYTTIYEALDAAASGDIVEVAPGTYDQFDTRPAWFGDNVSAVGFLKDGVILKSSNGAAVTTLRLDSNTARPVVLFGSAGVFHVEGFTISGSLPDLIGIAIQTPDDQFGTLNLIDCVIRDYGMSDPVTHELAIDVYNVDTQIHGCTIANLDSPNSVAAYFAGGHHVIEDSFFENCTGGALEVVSLFLDVQLFVRRCSFENNGQPQGGQPFGKGAISAQTIYRAEIEDSWFSHNSVAILFGCDFEGGGGQFGSVLIVHDNTFSENSGIGSQAAICALVNDAELIGNTFYGGDSGAGALNFNGLGPDCDLRLERNVFSFSTGEPAVDVSFLQAGGGVDVVTGCNVFWQNAGGHTDGFSLGAFDLVANPQFCDAPKEDFTVSASSPCLPWNNNSCGQIGAWGLGCGDVSVEPSSWGQIKALYR